MKSLFLIVCLSVFSYEAICQELSDTVDVQRTFGVGFKQNGRKLKVRDLVEISRSNPEAYKEMRIAKSNYDASQVLGYAGGFLIGWPLGTALGGGKPNWTLAAVGGGLILVSIPFSSEFAKHSMKSMAIYNNGLKQTARVVRLKLGVSATGVKFEMRL